MPFKCDYCARLFKHKRSRDRHTKLHTGDRRYRCLHCEAAFSRSDHLKIHMKTHDNQKPFQCTICNRGYNTAAALTSHMQNHKKQLALTGSPNLTYSPRSTTSSLSSGGGSGGGKRAAKFSPYATGDPLLLMGRTSKQLAKAGGSSSGGSTNTANNRTPTPGGIGAGGQGGPIGAGGSQPDLLSCPYCTRTDFPSLEQLGLHVQSMHGHGALGMLAADTPLPYFPSHLRGGGPGVGRRAVTPDASSLSLGPSYPPIPCDFCTMKFPTVPLMFAHLKASHFDRLAGGTGRGAPSDGGGSPSGTVGPSRPPSGYHPLDQLHFNKSILGNTFSSFYGGPFGGSGAATTSSGGGSIKVERRSAGLPGRDENGNEPEEPKVKRRRRVMEDDNREEYYNDDEAKVGVSLPNVNEDVMDEEDDVVGGNNHAQETDGNYEDEDEDEEEDVNTRENEVERRMDDATETCGRVKQESHDAMSHTSSARSSPCESVASSTHLPPGHTSGGECSPAEQLTPTDLSQPKMKRLKLEALEDDGGEDEEGRSQSHDVHHRGKRDGHNRRESESKEFPGSLQGPPSVLSSLQQHHSHNHHHSSMVTSSTTQSTGTTQHAQVTQAPSLPPADAAAPSLPPGAYLCNQCNAALPDFESFRTHLKAHLEQSAAAAMRLSGVDASVVGNGGSGNAALSLSAFLCQQCGATLSCQAEYEQHTIGHYLVTAVEYRCQAAGSSSACATGKAATFGKVEDLHKHLYEGHMQLLYKCTVCGETFETKVQAQVHFAVNHSVEVKLYRCSACAEVCRTERDFRQHIRNRHLAAGAVQCMFCRMVCSSELEMHFHLASHARKFKCPACPESFHVEFLLDRHIQTQHSQKETGSEVNRRECASGNTQPMLGTSVTSSVSNSSVNGTNTNVVSSSATVTSTVSTAHSSSTGSSLEYLQLQGQMAAMAAAAAAASTGWPSLYQTANKFYANPLHVDTLSQLKHPQHLLHGFYDTMLGKTQQQHQQQQQQQHQQQNRNNFISEPTTSGSGSKKPPFVGDIPSGSSKVSDTLLGLGYGGTSATAQTQRPVNGTGSGLYSPESAATNRTTANPGNVASSKLYSPIAMIQRYGENGPLGSTGAERVGPTASAVESPTTATGPSMLPHPTIAGLSGQHPPEQAGRKPNAPSSAGGKHSERPSGGGPGGAAPTASAGPQSTPGASSCCYSCGICERTDFSTESEVQTHRKIVHNLKTGVSLRCAYCNG
uniref:C2H2-type domain-containing protein n=1 Tax=Anopheles atroparvus TaxID=41427 RepID=A0AAG5DHJ9_ANOAO